MTATPIPRTLALTIYGDLEASVLDELPPGRTPIVTRRMPEERAGEVWDFVRKQVAQGRQAYIVYPIIEGERDDQPELDFAHDASEPQSTGWPTIADRRQPQSRPKLRAARSAASPRREVAATASRKLAVRAEPRTARKRAPHPHQTPLRLRDVRRAPHRRARRPQARPPPRPHVRRRQGRHHGPLPARRDRRPRLHHRHRSRRRRPQRHRHGHRTRRALRPRPAPPAPRTRRPRRREELLRPAHRRTRSHPKPSSASTPWSRPRTASQLAEIDLAQRGPGEFFGTRQAGLPEFRVANLARDRDLLELAKSEAARFVAVPRPRPSPRPNATPSGPASSTSGSAATASSKPERRSTGPELAGDREINMHRRTTTQKRTKTAQKCSETP